MRVLGIETSTTQASVALVENGRVILERAHARPKQSAERLLPLVAELLGEAGWDRHSLGRVGVSVGPGSFTGLRVGIACAQGLALGLGVPLVGVTSLRGMARGAETEQGTRCAVLDARRNEVFVGAYAPGPLAAEVLRPRALPISTAVETVVGELGGSLVWLGSALSLLGLSPSSPGPGWGDPSAGPVGLLAELLDPLENPADPLYLRDAGATLPDLGAPAQH